MNDEKIKAWGLSNGGIIIGKDIASQRNWKKLDKSVEILHPTIIDYNQPSAGTIMMILRPYPVGVTKLHDRSVLREHTVFVKLSDVQYSAEVSDELVLKYIAGIRSEYEGMTIEIPEPGTKITPFKKIN